MKFGFSTNTQRGCIGVEFVDREVRVMHLVEDIIDGVPRVMIENAAVAGWDSPDQQGSALLAAWQELDTKEKRCAVTLSPPNIIVRPLTAHRRMPERDIRKAISEEIRGTGFKDTDAIHFRRLDDRTVAFGVARVSAVDEVERLASQAGLRVVAIEHEAYAWTRAMDLNAGTLQATLDVRAESVVLAVRGAQFSDLVTFERPQVGLGSLAADIAATLRKAAENSFATVSVLGTRVSHVPEQRLVDESNALVSSVSTLAHLTTMPLTLADDAELSRGLLAWSLAKGYLDSSAVRRAA